MKRVLIAGLAILSLSACESQRRGIDCVGLATEKRADIKYEVSPRNVVVGLIFSETFLIPGYVIAFELECPKEMAAGVK